MSALVRGRSRMLPVTIVCRALPGCIVSVLAAALLAAQNTSPVAAPTPGDLAAMAQAKADSVERPYTEADIRFMSGMISHHAQAVVMAGWAPSHGASPSIRTLCERIVVSQRDEIGFMQAWLRDRQLPVPEANAAGMKMLMNGQAQTMLMPGMLTEDQMHRLDAARGPEFDRLFLADMIQHHRGAVTMVSSLFDTYGAGQDETVFKLASDIAADQTAEIARMERMLLTLATPDSTP